MTLFRRIGVQAGESLVSQFALSHALELARLYSARLRIIVTSANDWEPSEQGSGQQREIFGTLNDRLDDASRTGRIQLETVFQGGDAVEGLLAEAGACDLLVIGMPTHQAGQLDAASEAIFHDDLPLFRKSDSAILVASSEAHPVTKLLVHYHGGTEGKWALRFAGEMAEKLAAALAVVSIAGTTLDAVALTNRAERYLAAYNLVGLETIERTAPAESAREIVAAADSVNADFIIIGNKPYGLLDRFFAGFTAEEVIAITARPVLIAR